MIYILTSVGIIAAICFFANFLFKKSAKDIKNRINRFENKTVENLNKTSKIFKK